MNKKLLPVIFLVIAVACFSVAAYFAYSKYGEKVYEESIVDSDVFKIGAPKAAKLTITATIESTTEQGTIKYNFQGSGYYREISDNYSDMYLEFEAMNQKVQLVVYNKEIVVCGGYLENKCYKTSYEKLISQYSSLSPKEIKEINEEIKKIIEKYKDKLKEFKISKRVKGDTVTYEIKITKKDIIKFAPVVVEMYKEIIKKLSTKGYIKYLSSENLKKLESISGEEIASKLKEVLKNVSIIINIKIVAEKNKLKEVDLMFEIEKEEKSVKISSIATLEPMSESEVEKIISEKYSELAKNAIELPTSKYVYSYTY